MANLRKQSRDPEGRNRSAVLKIGSKRTLVMIYAVLIISAVVFIGPLLWLVSGSLKSNAELIANPWGLPTAPTLSNYVKAWTAAGMSTYFKNSIVTSLVCVVLTLVCSCPIAYMLARQNFRFKRTFFYYIIAGMMIPMHCVAIPVYLNTLDWGLQNNLFVLGIINAAFRIPFSVFVLEGLMSGIPRELEECASIDGCSMWGSFLKIILPLSRDGMITVGILALTSSWNELLISTLLLNDPAKKTLAIGLRGFVSEFTTEYTQLFAALFIGCLPGLIAYAVAQKQMIKGVTMGAVKG